VVSSPRQQGKTGVGHCEAATQSNSNGQTAGVGERSRSNANSNDSHPPAAEDTPADNDPCDNELDDSDGEGQNDVTPATDMEARYGPECEKDSALKNLAATTIAIR
jgi:hypothetical protein